MLAQLLAGHARRDLIVVSFKQQAVDRFHELAPAIAVAPGVDGAAAFLLGGGSPGDGVVAFQLPITYELGDQTLRRHDAGERRQGARRRLRLAHVAERRRRERRRRGATLIDWCVDGVMTARPVAFEQVLRRAPGAGGVRMMDLDPVEVRILGCLIEKQRTTPDRIRSASTRCGSRATRRRTATRSSQYDETTIREALHRLSPAALLAAGERAHEPRYKFRHLLDEALELDPEQLAVLAVLMLRGAQTPGELKQRTERMQRLRRPRRRAGGARRG